MSKVVVLNDGETYSSLSGCVILTVPDGVDDDALDEYVKENAHRGLSIETLDNESE